MPTYLPPELVSDLIAAGGGGGSSSLTVVSGGTVDLDNTKPDGYLIGYKVTATTTIEGVSFAAGSYIFERDSAAGGGWSYRTLATGTSVAPPDTTLPTAGTLSVTTTGTEGNLSVSGALDETALHATPYAFSKDNGTTWTAYQAGATYQFTGLTSSTSYTFKHKVKDAAGNEKIGTAVTASTLAVLTWTTMSSENYTGVADNTLIDGMTPDVGTALAVYDGKTVATTGARSTLAKVISEASGTIAGSGLAQAAYSTIWTGLTTTAKGFRVTFNYDISGATVGGGFIACVLPMNGGFTNNLTIGVTSLNAVHFDRFGGAAPTVTTVGSPPTINDVGKVTVVATGTHAAQDWVIKIYFDDVLHTTYTMTGSTFYVDKIALQHQPGALGSNVSRIKDFQIERAS